MSAMAMLLSRGGYMTSWNTRSRMYMAVGGLMEGEPALPAGASGVGWGERWEWSWDGDGGARG